MLPLGHIARRNKSAAAGKARVGKAKESVRRRWRAAQVKVDSARVSRQRCKLPPRGILPKVGWFAPRRCAPKLIIGQRLLAAEMGQ